MPRLRHSARLVVAAASLIVAHSVPAGDWPEAAGPAHNYHVAGQAPTAFSVSRNEGIRWRVPLPNTGESTPVISAGRIFLTCHAPTTADAQAGSTIFGFCFDAETGRELWRRELPGTRETDMASGFSDNTAASPVADGQSVCFVNVGGSVRTFDFAGNLVWQHDWVPFGRHHSRQQEPILYEGQVLLLRTMATDLPASATGKDGAHVLGANEKYWTRLQAFSLATGERTWVAEAGTSVHSASLLGRTAAGVDAILTGRGGGHQPPETPYGLSLLRAADGTTLWDLPMKDYGAHQNAVWNSTLACCFVGKDHLTIDLTTGRPRDRVSLERDVRLCRWREGRYESVVEPMLEGIKKPTTYHTNCLIGDYHYFRAHNQFLIGRVNVRTNRVAYLQVPVQVVREQGRVDDVRWTDALPNDVKNVDGFVVCQDNRAMSHGWGHVSAASPIVVGDYLYMPTMLGMVYILKWNAAELGPETLVSISDLGPAQHTWTLSSLTYADGRLYARTLKELICIDGTPSSRP